MITRTPKLLLPMLFGVFALLLAPGAAHAQDGYSSGTMDDPRDPSPTQPAPPQPAPVVPRVTTQTTGHIVTVKQHTSQSGDVAAQPAPAVDSVPTAITAPQITIASNPGQTGNSGFSPEQVGPDGPPPAELAFTGPETPYLAFSGLGLVALGLAASAAARRRLRDD